MPELFQDRFCIRVREKGVQVPTKRLTKETIWSGSKPAIFSDIDTLCNFQNSLIVSFNHSSAIGTPELTRSQQEDESKKG